MELAGWVRGGRLYFPHSFNQVNTAFCYIGARGSIWDTHRSNREPLLVSYLFFYRFCLFCIPHSVLPEYLDSRLGQARINRFSGGFFPSASHLWNSFPSSVFLASFKRQVYHHLRDQMS